MSMLEKRQKYNLINFGFNPWSNYWKRNQTIVYLLSKSNNVENVLFLNSEVWLLDLARDPRFALSSVHRNYWKFVFPRKVSPKIKVYTPFYFPFEFRLKPVHKFFQQAKYQILKSFIKSPYILILNNPQADKAMVWRVAKTADLTIFDWSDDFVEFSTNPLERKICWETCKLYCEMADLVLTVNENLRKKALRFNERTYTLPNATNFFTFGTVKRETGSLSHVSKLKGKKVGYVGWLNSLRLDLELLEHIIKERPKINFLFIGPKSEKWPLGYLIPKMPNAYILPPIPYPDYPFCVSSLDVCILPNKLSAHTRGNDPIKIYDYLASGRPIVSTKCSGTEKFENYIYLADNKYDFLTLLDKALKENSREKSRVRKAIALEHSWQKRMDVLIEIIRETFPKVEL